MKRSTVAIYLSAMLALAGAQVLAGPEDPSAQVAAARQNAVKSLQTQVDHLQIAPGLSVGSFLAQTGTAASIAEIEEKAATFGGPRWIDDQTVQLKVDLPGSELVSQLVSIAATHPNGPISPAALEQRLAGLKRVSLIGTGTSLKNAGTTFRPPGVNDAWASISDADRSHAVTVARKDADERVLANLAEVRVAPTQTAGDLLKRQPVREAVRSWLSTRPVSDVQFKDDLQVELTVSAPRRELLQTVVGAARSDGVKLDDQPVESLSNDPSPMIASVGHASVGGEAPPPSRADHSLPEQPPSWTAQPIDAQGVGPRERSPLRTKAAAEADATEVLRTQIEALRVDQNRTLGDLAKSDSRVESAISSSLLRAHVYKVEWRADGTAAVRITLDTRDLWDELMQATH